MRWPFRPPHLTLKPSKKNNPPKKQKKQKKIKSTKKELFSYQPNFSFILVGVQIFPFLTTWPKKHAPKNTIKIGVSTIFLKNRSGSRSGHFLTKKTQNQKFQLSFVFAFFFFFNNKNHKHWLKPPTFIVFLQTPKR